MLLSRLNFWPSDSDQVRVAIQISDLGILDIFLDQNKSELSTKRFFISLHFETNKRRRRVLFFPRRGSIALFCIGDLRFDFRDSLTDFWRQISSFVRRANLHICRLTDLYLGTVLVGLKAQNLASD